MGFVFDIKTKIIMGEDCVLKNGDVFKMYGKRAFVTTSKSAKRNGVYDDLCKVFDECGIVYEFNFDTLPNPTVESCREIGKKARNFKADMIIGAGGGSPMDLSKAVAVFALNEEISDEDLFKGNYEAALPIIAIPTTCGTGSEVTNVSVLTVGDSKKSFSNGLVAPKVALLDEKYLKGIPSQILTDTACDALSHALEGYLMFDEPMTDMLCHKVFEIFGKHKNALLNKENTKELREEMLFAAMLAGIVIMRTKTSAVHSMGYPVTVFKGYSHGRACGILLGNYTKICYGIKKDKIDGFLNIIGEDSVDGFIKLMSELLLENDVFTEEEIEKYVKKCAAASIAKKNPVQFTEDTVRDLFKVSLM